MRKRTVRLIIVLALVSIIGITVTQLYWVVTKYRQEKEEFERKTEKALQKVAEDILILNNNQSKIQQTTVRQLAGDYYVVNINDEITFNYNDNELTMAAPFTVNGQQVCGKMDKIK